MNSKEKPSFLISINSPSSSIPLWLGLFVLALGGFWVTLYATQWGAGLIDWDSFNYLAAAHSLANGLGFVLPLDNQTFMPMTHFPPMLSILLAVLESMGVIVIDGIKWLNAILFAINIVLLGFSIYSIYPSLPFAWLGVTIFFVSNTFILAHALALSEPLLIFFTLFGFLSFVPYLRHKSMFYLTASILLLSFACLTKYIGVVSAFTAAIVFIIMQNKINLRAIGKGIIFGGLCVFPLFIWTLRGIITAHTFNNRTLSWYPLTINNLVQAFRTIISLYVWEDFILGYEKWLYYFMVFLFLIIVVYTIKNYSIWIDILNKNSMILIYGLYIIFYTVFVFISKMLFDPEIGMSSRMFSPILMALIILTVIFLSFLWKTKILALRIIVLIFSMYWVSYQVNQGYQEAVDLHENGYGLARRSIHLSDTIAHLKEISQQEDVYSNNPYLLYFVSGKPGFRINAFEIEPKNEQKLLAIFKNKTGSKEYNKNKLSPYLHLVEEDRLVSLYRFTYKQ